MSDPEDQKRRLRLRLKKIHSELLSYAIRAGVACAVIVWFSTTGPANGVKEWMTLIASVLILFTFLVVVARYVLQRKRAVRDIVEEIPRGNTGPN
jgi:hypothetical protein